MHFGLKDNASDLLQGCWLNLDMRPQALIFKYKNEFKKEAKKENQTGTRVMGIYQPGLRVVLFYENGKAFHLTTGKKVNLSMHTEDQTTNGIHTPYYNDEI